MGASIYGVLARFRFRDRWKRVLIAAVLVFVAIRGVGVDAQRPVFTDTPRAGDPLETLHVAGNVYLIAGAGGNIAAQVGVDGVVLVDSGLEEFVPQVLEEIQKLSQGQIRAIINTSIDLDRIGGNDQFAQMGSPLYWAQNTGRVSIAGAQLIGHEQGVVLLSAAAERVPTNLWPYETFFGSLKTIYGNGEAVEIHYSPAAHTNGDTMVFFRRSDVIVAGPAFDTTSYPRIDRTRGGSVQGVLDVLNHIIDLTVPAYNQMGGTMVIPGRGRIADESDVVEYRDMLTIIRDRVALRARTGQTLEDVLDAGVSLEYDGIYGSTTGAWTTRMFLQAVYEEVTAAQ